MDKLNLIINDIKQLRGAEVSIFGQPTTLPEEVEALTVDILPILEEFKAWECDMIIERYDEDEDEYTEEEAETVEEYLEYLEELGEISDVDDYTGDNSYNWASPLSNHIDIRVYKGASGREFMELRVHRYGDVRANYTESTLLEFDSDYTFYEILFENSAYVDIEVDGVEYSVTVEATSDMLQVYNRETGEDFEVYAVDMDDLEAEIKEATE